MTKIKQEADFFFSPADGVDQRRGNGDHHWNAWEKPSFQNSNVKLLYVFKKKKRKEKGQLHAVVETAEFVS